MVRQGHGGPAASRRRPSRAVLARLTAFLRIATNPRLHQRQEPATPPELFFFRKGASLSMRIEYRGCALSSPAIESDQGKIRQVVAFKEISTGMVIEIKPEVPLGRLCIKS